MKIAGHDEFSIQRAVDRASEVYNHNIKLVSCERGGTTGRSKYLNVRIGVYATRDDHGNVLPGVRTTRDFSRNSKNGLRANNAASWDAHGEFMYQLFVANPDTVIRSGSIAHGSKVYKSVGDLFKSWSAGPMYGSSYATR